MKILSSFTHIMPFQTTVFRAQCCSTIFHSTKKASHAILDQHDSEEIMTEL